ncbi:MAG TPA: NfeD family protein [Clostridiales bacterium]|nr:NfeD family protein [Clostridiales bacterium]HBK26035.1 NfeD family protein [Clostridiales bacterium]HCP71756.1 NfeD family protein [Clostridiales bacterium]
MESAAIFWLVLLVVFLIVEAACPIHLVSVWFAMGALVALLGAALDAPVWLQIVLFVVVSGALLALLWPLAKKFLNPQVTATNVDSVIGTVGIVTASIDNVEALGQVKLGGMEWSARSTSGDTIPTGTEVRVDRVEGVKVFVTPVKAAVTV